MVLLLVGTHSERLIGRHKRLAAFDVAAFRLLLDYIGDASLVTLPNALTETSNLMRQGVAEPARSHLAAKLAAFAQAAFEEYIPSRQAAAVAEFPRLGLTDAAWLQAVEPQVELLTVDLALYVAALNRGLQATNFNHLRSL